MMHAQSRQGACVLACVRSAGSLYTCGHGCLAGGSQTHQLPSSWHMSFLNTCNNIPTCIKHLRQGVMKFFKELYANGDEDFRRAMVKSYVNSGARTMRGGRNRKLCDCIRLLAL